MSKVRLWRKQGKSWVKIRDNQLKRGYCAPFWLINCSLDILKKFWIRSGVFHGFKYGWDNWPKYDIG